MIDFTCNGVNFAVLERQLPAGEIDRSVFLEYASPLDVGASAVRDKCRTAMSRAVCIASRSDRRRHEAVLRLSETPFPSREPEDMTKILSEQTGDFLRFCRVVCNENSTEVEWVDLGRAKSLVSMYVDLPVEQRPFWQAYCTQEPFETSGWNADERVPARLKQGFRAQGIQTGPVVFVPSRRRTEV